jgi:adenine-specific DNA-methyltransferase
MSTKRKLNLSSEKEIVSSYEFEPIQGYPMLNWKGKRPFRSTQYYPAQLKEVHGPEVNGWRNRIYWGDNLQIMSHLLKGYRGKMDLVYIDPPFDSKADYKKRIQLRGKAIANDQTVFEEKQYTDIWTNDEYLQFMYERLILIRELLADTGSIYLHCDWHKVHHLRCLMDEIFGPEHFKNEIVWQRFNYRADGKKFGAVHDSILFYTKTEEFTFEKPYVSFSPSYIKTHFRPDEDGRLFRLDNLTAPAHGKDGKSLYFGKRQITPPAGTMWRFAQEGITDLWDKNFIVIPDGGGVPQVKRYLDEVAGQAVHSIWTDVRGINSQAIERTDYPTQKPESLLERIIQASSKPGDIVFDCFMGSGTAQVVAMKSGRRFIGADINLGAVQTTAKRLLEEAQEPEQHELEENELTRYMGFEIYDVNYYDVFRNPVQAKDLLLEALEIQPLVSSAAGMYDGEKDGRMVKIMPINRIATRVDLNELIAGFDYRTFERRQAESPGRPVEKLLLVCMGHEPDLAAHLKSELHPFKIDIEVVDVLRDESHLEFRRPSEALLRVKKGNLVIERFYPMNLLQKLSLMKEDVKEWRELVESVMVDWNYDGAVLTPAVMDVPGRDELVSGSYSIPEGAGTIRVKITDVLSESWEGEIQHG